MKLSCALLCWIIILVIGLHAGEQKKVIVDFEDAGSWRQKHSLGIKPGYWSAGYLSFSGTDKEKFQGDRTGELKFAFDPAGKGSFQISFERAKMSLVSGFLKGIEFDANPKGIPVSVRFEIMDFSKNRFLSEPVALSGKEWKHYRLDINEKTMPDIANCKFPAVLKRIVLQSEQPCEGKVYFDDITLCGEFPKKELLAILPVYEGVSYSTEKPVTLRYYLRNAQDEKVKISLKISVADADGKEHYSENKNLEIAAYGMSEVKFNAPVLPIGPYFATVTAKGGSLDVRYDDTFGVFVPNGMRINRKPMWFGMVDDVARQGEPETELHLQWKKALGVDLERHEFGAGRFEPQNGVILAEPWGKVWNDMGKADIDVLVLYHTSPSWTQSINRGALKPVEDYDLFFQHAKNVGAYFKKFTNVKYVEFWNEPDIHAFEGSSTDYLKMLESFYKGIKETYPQIKVTTGGVTILHPKEKPMFSYDMYRLGKESYDVAAFHSHGPLENYTERQEILEKWLEKSGINKPIGNTETGERSGYDMSGRLTQAVTLVKKIVYAKSRPSTEFYLWFLLQDYWDMDPEADDSFGLVTSDNRVKPSFLAYNELIRQLANTDSGVLEKWSEGVRSYSFKKDNGKTVYVCWSEAGSGGSLLWCQSKGEIRKIGIYGASETLTPIQNVCAVSVSGDPFYLETSSGNTISVSQGAGFIGVDTDLEVWGDGPYKLPMTIQNPSKEKMRGSLSLADPSGKSFWSKEVSLDAGQKENFVSILPDLKGGKYELSYKQDVTKGELKFPILVTKVYEIKKAPDNPMGESMSAFVKALPFIPIDTLQDVFELTFDPTIQRWMGKEDLSAQIQACYDSEGIYFRVEVTDDKFVQNNPQNQMWKGDSLQIAVSRPGEKSYPVLDVGLVDGKQSVVWCSRHSDVSKRGKWDIPVRVQKAGSNLIVYEVYIPFAKLGIDGMKSGSSVLFSVLINEDDGQGRVRWIHWADGIGKGNDTSLLGKGILR